MASRDAAVASVRVATLDAQPRRIEVKKDHHPVLAMRERIEISLG